MKDPVLKLLHKLPSFLIIIILRSGRLMILIFGVLVYIREQKRMRPVTLF